MRETGAELSGNWRRRMLEEEIFKKSIALIIIKRKVIFLCVADLLRPHICLE